MTLPELTRAWEAFAGASAPEGQLDALRELADALEHEYTYSPVLQAVRVVRSIRDHYDRVILYRVDAAPAAMNPFDNGRQIRRVPFGVYEAADRAKMFYDMIAYCDQEYPGHWTFGYGLPFTFTAYDDDAFSSLSVFSIDPYYGVP